MSRAIQRWSVPHIEPKLQHWRGFQGKNARRAAPVVKFCHRILNTLGLIGFASSRPVGMLFEPLFAIGSAGGKYRHMHLKPWDKQVWRYAGPPKQYGFFHNQLT